MVLRKHLLGARLTGAGQFGLDRILWLTFTRRRGAGSQQFHLTAELFGPRPNLILVQADGIIVDALRRIPAEKAARPALPGLNYQQPPLKHSLWDPFVDSEEQLVRSLQEHLADGKPPRRALGQVVAGLGPILARETELRCSPPAEGAAPNLAAALAAAVMSWSRILRQKGPQPTAAWKPDGHPAGLAVVPLTGHKQVKYEVRPFKSCGAAADALLGQSQAAQSLQRQITQLGQQLTKEVKRAQRLVKARQRDLQRGTQGQKWRLYADLLTANLWQWPDKNTLGREIRLPNLAEPDGAEIAIPLDPALTPNENAELYYQRYRRAQRTQRLAAAKLTEAERELDYLASLALHVEQAESEAELAELAAEWSSWQAARKSSPRRADENSAGKSKAGRRRQARARQTSASQPRRFRSPTGLPIFVGHNNRQNDRLTFGQAAPYDLWFHARNIPGAHVVVRLPHAQSPVDEETIQAAAMLAAYYSQGRHSSGVPVDWTRVKNVRKIPGARPGMVRYDGQQTLAVTPDANLVKRLAADNGENEPAE